MIKDLYWEHLQHNEYEEKCSECYRENRIIKAKRIVMSDYNEGLTNEAKMRNPWGSNYPTGFRPE